MSNGLSRSDRVRATLNISDDPDLATPRLRFGADLKRPFNDDPGTQFDGFLNIWSTETDDLHTAAEDVLLSAAPDTATGEQLNRLGRRVFVPRRTGEGDNRYRGRIKVELRKRVGGGTIGDVKEVSAALLNSTEDAIGLSEDFSNQKATFTLSIDPRTLENAGVSQSDYLEFIGEIKAAGVRVNAIQRGTFEFRAAGDVSDPAKGWDGLDYTGEAGDWAGLLGVV